MKARFDLLNAETDSGAAGSTIEDARSAPLCQASSHNIRAGSPPEASIGKNGSQRHDGVTSTRSSNQDASHQEVQDGFRQQTICGHPYVHTLGKALRGLIEAGVHFALDFGIQFPAPESTTIIEIHIHVVMPIAAPNNVWVTS